jgi:hypothetical protein
METMKTGQIFGVCYCRSSLAEIIQRLHSEHLTTERQFPSSDQANNLERRASLTSGPPMEEYAPVHGLDS